MKKLSLIVLLGLALSAVVSGCNNAGDNGSNSSTSTNAPAAPANTNKP